MIVYLVLWKGMWVLQYLTTVLGFILDTTISIIYTSIEPPYNVRCVLTLVRIINQLSS